MTFISRRSRIIISRWSDECDAEYRLKASRKRSDGRLKRHSSCDDLRAWVNNNCVKNEHLLDLMSDGEAIKKSQISLYGRFIPVPLLFKVLQNTQLNGGESKGRKNENREFNLSSNSSLTMIQCEKFLLEKRLLKCTGLLSKALDKLEKIDSIVCLAWCDSERARSEEIKEAFSRSKAACCCSCSSQTRRTSAVTSSSNSYVRKTKESAKCTELWRKISDLEKKLIKIQEYQQEINEQIQTSQQRLEKCSFSPQVTKLYCRREQRLQKKWEKLIAEKGRIFTEMCKLLDYLHNKRKSSRSNISFCKKNHSKSNEREKEYRNLGYEETTDNSCNNQFSKNCNSSDSEVNVCNYSSSDGSMASGCFKEAGAGFIKDRQTNSPQNLSIKNSEVFRRFNLENYSKEKSPDTSKYSNENKQSAHKKPQLNNPSKFSHSRSHSPKNFKKVEIEANEKMREEKSGKRSKLKFVCPEEECKKKNFTNEVTLQSFLKQQEESSQKGFVSSTMFRPSTSPTTRAEKLEKSIDRHSKNLLANIPGRKIKSETTMKEIEKALRNYEERLEDFDGLEYKIEELKQKLSDANTLKKKLVKEKAEGKKLRAAEREKSNKEITELCSENWELKKQIQQLVVKFKTQCKTIQTLKCSAKKTKELECEAEKLKKELLKYQDGYEHQRKCITKLENVVAKQNTEIENLMNNITRLSMMKQSTALKPYFERKNIQRSRSYSPESIKYKGPAMTKTVGREYRPTSDEEDVVCCYNDCRQVDSRNMQRGYKAVCCPALSARRMEWCMN